MRKVSLIWTMAALVVFSLLLSSCGKEKASSLLSGKFGTNKSFSVNEADARGVFRAIGSDTTIYVKGLLRDGDKVYELVGFYDKADGFFSLSSFAENKGFELTGKVGDAKAKIKDKTTGGEWEVDMEKITFLDLEVGGTANVASAASMPESWWGLYDFSRLTYEYNNLGVEAWMTGSSDDERGLFVMLLGPYSMDFWCNTDLMRSYLEKIEWGPGIDDQITIYNKIQSSFTVLEVSGSGSTYEVLLLLTILEDRFEYDMLDPAVNCVQKKVLGVNAREGFRKAKFVMASDGKITATLAGSDYPFVFKTAASAKNADYDDVTWGDQNKLVFERWGW